MTKMSTQNARLAGILGLIAIIGNVAAVMLLKDMPAAYRLARLDEWVGSVVEQPFASNSSAISFCLGLIALAYWGQHLGRSVGNATGDLGGWLIASTALLNAAGTLTPLIQTMHVGACGEACAAVGRALLGLSLSLDALFNLGLGVGLLLFAWAIHASILKRALLLIAGLSTLLVSGQALWDPAADMLSIAAPLWLLVILWTSLAWMSGRDFSGVSPVANATTTSRYAA